LKIVLQFIVELYICFHIIIAFGDFLSPLDIAGVMLELLRFLPW